MGRHTHIDPYSVSVSFSVLIICMYVYIYYICTYIHIIINYIYNIFVCGVFSLGVVTVSHCINRCGLRSSS